MLVNLLQFVSAFILIDIDFLMVNSSPLIHSLEYGLMVARKLVPVMWYMLQPP